MNSANSFSYGIVIPTRNGGALFQCCLNGVLRQVPGPARVVVMDSESSDQTRAAAEASGAAVVKIALEEFDHGRTRQIGASLLGDVDVVVFLTQDAVLEDAGAVRCLLAAFDDARVGGAFGRQVARSGACVLESFSRAYNYRPESYVADLQGLRLHGFKAAFFSNSFGAFRVSALEEVGGLCHDVVFGEDTMTAARLLKAGWKIAYQSDARVVHSHAVSVGQEFRRSFDMGVMHASQEDVLVDGGTAGAEGVRFVQAQARECLRVHPASLVRMMGQLAAKTLGYSLGRSFRYLPTRVCLAISANRSYWIRRREFERVR